MMAASRTSEVRGVSCFHCGLPVPSSRAPSSVLGSATRLFCCTGCQAVATMIFAGGHAAYYERREAPGQRPAGPAGGRAGVDDFADDPEFQRTFVRRVAGDLDAILELEGAHCSACGWLIEKHLASLDGVIEATVGVATGRIHVRWRPERIALSSILAAIRDVGYAAAPHVPGRDESRRRLERRGSLRRLGIAGLGSMQVMMFAVALYAGDASGMEPVHRQFLRYASWVVTTVVVVAAARPFFVAAARQLGALAPGMDVPVALAIGVAYLASGWATLTGSGPVYFESACMFTFLLGLTRHVEMSARHARDARIRSRFGTLPDRAARLVPDGVEWVPTSALRPGDRVRLEPGDGVPADGRLVDGGGWVDESLLTGEAEPRRREVGDPLVGGSRWLEARSTLLVERVGIESTAARIENLIERAQLERPPVQRMADRVAVYFVSGVLLAAAGVFVAWSLIAPADALWITLSVLVASCPCALSLATPAALAAAGAALAERGFLVCRGRVLESLDRVDHVVFDKTGTLTWPEHRVTRVIVGSDDWNASRILGLARAMERHSDHPLASAFRGAPENPDVARSERAFVSRLEQIETRPGLGVEARLDGSAVRIGRIEGAGPGDDRVPMPGVRGESWLAVSHGDRLVGWIGTASPVRPDAAALIASLHARGVATSLASGDPSERAVHDVARQVGIEVWRADVGPHEKVEWVAALQRSGATVAVVGDGRNDAPVLARADVGIALGSGADIARGSADAVILGDRLGVLDEACRHAARTRRIIRQNLVWAVAYNAAVLPAAAMGALAPWMAALGMSASSVLVVANSLRLRRLRGASPGRGRVVAPPMTRPVSPVWAGP